MVDYTKPQPCQECYKMVKPNEKHTYNDCLNWKEKIKSRSSDKTNKEEKE